MDRLDLRDIPLFSGFSAEAVGFLEGRLKEIALEPGQALATVGANATSIFFIGQGWVRLLDASGKELARSGPGSVIGEADALSSQRYGGG
ncbi:MAG: cyclic nucleotide-binding domain-containing protein, partial [Anaerolineae bacterium]